MFVLIGDSQFVRMNNNFPWTDTKCWAVSGASVTPLPNNPQLKAIVKAQLSTTPLNYHVLNTAILMAGTNDFLNRVDFEEYKKHFLSLKKLLKRHFFRIILVFPPPIPLLGQEANHQIRYLGNWFSSQKSPCVDVVISTYSSFLNPDTNQPSPEFFESHYEGRFIFQHNELQQKVDRVHLNELGLFILKQLILSRIEERFP